MLERATVLSGAAQRIWPVSGFPLFGSTCFRAPHQHCQPQACHVLGDATFRPGTELTIEAAVDYALGGEGPEPTAAAQP